jgi:hypothetical protein
MSSKERVFRSGIKFNTIALIDKNVEVDLNVFENGVYDNDSGYTLTFVDAIFANYPTSIYLRVKSGTLITPGFYTVTKDSDYQVTFGDSIGDSASDVVVDLGTMLDSFEASDGRCAFWRYVAFVDDNKSQAGMIGSTWYADTANVIGSDDTITMVAGAADVEFAVMAEEISSVWNVVLKAFPDQAGYQFKAIREVI